MNRPEGWSTVSVRSEDPRERSARFWVRAIDRDGKGGSAASRREPAYGRGDRVPPRG